MVIDVKFFLEGFVVYWDVKMDVEKLVVRCEFVNVVVKYIKDILMKYIVFGEMVDFVFMFLLLEVVYVELYVFFVDVVKRSYVVWVWIVFLIIMMVILNMIRVVLKDVKMCEQVGVI